MVRKKSHDLGGAGFRYAELERALGVMLDAGEAGEGALRGRLKRLSSLGIPGGGTGKGSRRLYRWEEATLLAVALLLEDIGLDPVIVAAALKNTWPKLASKVAAAVEASADNPVLLVIPELETVAAPWRTGDPLAGLPWISIARRMDERAKARRVKMYREHFAKLGLTKLAVTGPSVDKLGHTEAAVLDLINRLAMCEADNITMMLNRNKPGWFPVRNLTDRLAVLKAALEQKEPYGRS